MPIDLVRSSILLHILLLHPRCGRCLATPDLRPRGRAGRRSNTERAAGDPMYSIEILTKTHLRYGCPLPIVDMVAMKVDIYICFASLCGSLQLFPGSLKCQNCSCQCFGVFGEIIIKTGQRIIFKLPGSRLWVGFNPYVEFQNLLYMS